MPDEAGRVTPTSPAGGASDSTAFGSFAALRQAHFDLVGVASSSALDSGPAGRAGRIGAFIARARATGAVLADVNERRAAQGILDYWSVELAGLPDVAASEVMPEPLAPYVIQHAAAPPEEAAAAVPKRLSRDVIRVSALARQYQASKDPGWLISGGALAEASKLKDRDPDVKDFVEASEVEVQRLEVEVQRLKRNQKRFLVIAAIVLLIVSSVGTLLLVQFRGLPLVADWAMDRIRNPESNAQQLGLRTLSFIQPWVTPARSDFDLSNIVFGSFDPSVQFTDLPGLTLHFPNFSASTFRGVDFAHATMVGASFNDSQQIEDSCFFSTDLQKAQFVRTRVRSTSFAKAKLYRAVFDGASLCDVDFSEADLREASFRNVRLSDSFVKHFRNTAWWLAVGWNSDQRTKLGAEDASDLRDSENFMKRKDDSTKMLARATAGSFERAFWLNDLAWTLATYGVDVGDVIPVPKEECMTATGEPSTALNAADQAVCIVSQLKATATAKDGKNFDDDLANFQDTLGYVLLQAGLVSDALKNLALKNLTDAVTGWGERSPGDLLFRYAVAENAAGDKKKAIDALSKSIKTKRYFPSHEFKWLDAYLKNPAFAMFAYTLEPLLKTNAEPPPPCPEAKATRRLCPGIPNPAALRR